MAVGNGRADLIVIYGEDRFVLELKLMQQKQSEAKAVKQLARYLDRLGMSHGYLLLFELDNHKSWEERIRWQPLEEASKSIVLVGM
ncbi:MAG: hypothetical protein HQL48_04245 [Gammaproteobacteria bacterium]|nr:hypothetical protein [Gammaproteobacteria bacterium]